MKKIIVISSIVVAMLGGYFGYQGLFGGKEEVFAYETVSRGEVAQVVSVAGTVSPNKQIDLQFELSGKISNVSVSVGDSVVSGQVLARLDSSELNAQLQAARAALAMAQARLAQTLAGNRSEDIQVYAAAVDSARQAVAGKEQALADARAQAEVDLRGDLEDALDVIQTSQTKIDLAMTAISDLRQEYFSNTLQLSVDIKDKETIAKRSSSDFDSILALAEGSMTVENIKSVLSSGRQALLDTKDALSYLRVALDDASVSHLVAAADETSVDTQRNNIDTQLVGLTSAQQAVDATKIGNQTSINSAQQAVESAKIALTKAESELALRQAPPRQADIDLVRADVAQAEANVAQIREKIGKASLAAPVAGIVTAVEKERGEIVLSGNAIISLMSAGNFRIEANISEADIAKINAGDGIEMTLDALGPEEKFAGTVAEIDPAETVISGVIYYKITAMFDAENEQIRSGMTANLDIRTAKIENALYLPYFAVRQTNGRKYVLVEENGQRQEKDIRTGLEGETRVEILEGLEEGERVLIES